MSSESPDRALDEKEQGRLSLALGDISWEASTMARQKENNAKQGALPVEIIHDRISSQKHVDPVLPVNIPPMPPKSMITPSADGLEYGEQRSWYYIKSPREVYGATGPHIAEELKFMYETGDITDKTLAWRDGLPEWNEVQKIPMLRGIVHGLPKTPLKTQLDTNVSTINDDIDSNAAKRVIPLKTFQTDLWCGKCRGNLATCHIPGMGEQDPDIGMLRHNIGSTATVREIMPGYLFIGDKDTAKLSTIIPSGISLVLNCTENLKNPAARPPHYRCQVAKFAEIKRFKSTPLDQLPSTAFVQSDIGDKGTAKKIYDSDNDDDDDDDVDENKNDVVDDEKKEEKTTSSSIVMPEGYVPRHKPVVKKKKVIAKEEEVIEDPIPVEEDLALRNVLMLFDRCSDWIEIERINPELHEAGDDLPEVYRGPVDRYGRPQRPQDDAVKTKTASQRKKEGLEKKNPTRTLLWSKRGDNRSCAVAAAYFIKRFGVTWKKALQMVIGSVPEMCISPAYMWALIQYSKINTLGLLLCDDCIQNAIDDDQESKFNASRSDSIKRSTSHLSQDGTVISETSPFISRMQSLEIASKQEKKNEKVIEQPQKQNIDSPNLSSPESATKLKDSPIISRPTSATRLTTSRPASATKSVLSVSFSNDLQEKDESFGVLKMDKVNKKNGKNNDDNDLIEIGPEEEKTDEEKETSVTRFGNTGKPYIESREARAKMQEKISREREEIHLQKSKLVQLEISASSDAAARMRRRRRRSRNPDAQYDEMEVAVAGHPALVSLVTEGIDELLPICRVPQYVSNHETYHMLCDLAISGKRLSDDLAVTLFDSLDSLGAAKRLRSINIMDNFISDNGIYAMCKALLPTFETLADGPPEDMFPYTEITILHIANNRIGEIGIAKLAQFLKITSSVCYLDVSCNPIGDNGVHELCLAMVKPGLEFETADAAAVEVNADQKSDLHSHPDDIFKTQSSQDFSKDIHKSQPYHDSHQEEEDADAADDEGKSAMKAVLRKPFNQSVTDLCLRDVGIGEAGAVTLSNLLGRTDTLKNLAIDANENIPPKGLKNIIRSIKTLNKSIQILTLSDVKLLVNHFELILAVFHEGQCQCFS